MDWRLLVELGIGLCGHLEAFWWWTLFCYSATERCDNFVSASLDGGKRGLSYEWLPISVRERLGAGEAFEVEEEGGSHQGRDGEDVARTTTTLEGELWTRGKDDGKGFQLSHLRTFSVEELVRVEVAKQIRLCSWLGLREGFIKKRPYYVEDDVEIKSKRSQNEVAGAQRSLELLGGFGWGECRGRD